MASDERVYWARARAVVGSEERERSLTMTSEKPGETNAPEGQKAERRPYVAPTVSDFLQPVVALGSNGQTALCIAKGRPPKHP
jgi:hypothetical protein